MKFWDCYLKVVIIECVAVLLVIITALLLRYCFLKTFAEASDWYKQNVLIDTDVNEVIK